MDKAYLRDKELKVSIISSTTARLMLLNKKDGSIIITDVDFDTTNVESSEPVTEKISALDEMSKRTEAK